MYEPPFGGGEGSRTLNSGRLRPLPLPLGHAPEDREGYLRQR